MGWIFLLGIYFAPPIVAAIIARRSEIKPTKKRLVGLIVCHVIFILSFFLSLMVAALAGISGPSQDEAIKGPSPLRLVFILFPTIISVSTIGLWYRQRWGRICSLFVAAVICFAMVYSSYGSLFLVSKEMVSQNYAFAAIVAIIGIVFISVIYYLTRPNVKEQFK